VIINCIDILMVITGSPATGSEQNSLC